MVYANDLGSATAGYSLSQRPHTHGPWLKKVLIPFWTTQLLFQLLFTVIAILNCITAGVSTRPIFLTIFSILLNFMIIAEIVLFANHRLQPLAFLYQQIFIFVLWTSIIISVTTATVIEYNWQPGESPAVTEPGRPISLRGGFWVVLLAGVEGALFLGTLIYAIVIYVRHRRSLRRMREPADEWLKHVSAPLGSDRQFKTYGPWADNAQMNAYHELVTRPDPSTRVGTSSA